MILYFRLTFKTKQLFSAPYPDWVTVSPFGMSPFVSVLVQKSWVIGLCLEFILIMWGGMAETFPRVAQRSKGFWRPMADLPVVLWFSSMYTPKFYRTWSRYKQESCPSQQSKANIPVCTECSDLLLLLLFLGFKVKL